MPLTLKRYGAFETDNMFPGLLSLSVPLKAKTVIYIK